MGTVVSNPKLRLDSMNEAKLIRSFNRAAWDDVSMTEGSELVNRIVEDMRAHGLEPDSKESELLALAEGLADRLAELEQDIEADGRTMLLTNGRVVMNPAVAESRMTRTSLAGVLSRVSMVEGREKDPQKVKASNARWARHNLAKAQRSG